MFSASSSVNAPSSGVFTYLSCASRMSGSAILFIILSVIGRLLRLLLLISTTIASSANSLEAIKFFINSGRASSSIMLNRFLKSRTYASTSSAISLGSAILAILASNSTWFVCSHLAISSLFVSFSLSIASSSYLFAAAVSLACSLCAPFGARSSSILIVPPGNSNN